MRPPTLRVYGRGMRAYNMAGLSGVVVPLWGRKPLPVPDTPRSVDDIKRLNDQLKQQGDKYRFIPQDARVLGGERKQMAQRCPPGQRPNGRGGCEFAPQFGPTVNLFGYQGPGVGALSDITKLDKAQAVAVNQLVSSLASHGFVADPRSTVIFPKDLSLGYDTAQVLIDPMDDGGSVVDPVYIANFAQQLALSAAALDFTLADLGVDGNGVPINTGFQWNVPDVFGGVNPAPCGPRQLRKTDGNCADCTPNAHANDAGNGCACDAGYDLQSDGTCLLHKDEAAPAPTAAKPSKWPWVAAFVAIGGAVVLAVAKEKRA